MNKKYYIKKIICVSVCTVLSALFIVILFFCAPKISAVAEAEGSLSYMRTNVSEGNYTVEESTAVIGSDVTAVRINALGKLNKITKVNYVADRFVDPVNLDDEIRIVDLTKPFEFAEKGTLIFIVLNLDPWTENFEQQAQALDDYKIGDNWRFTLSLPKIFCASNVYQRTKLVAQHGEIADYDFIRYTTTYDKKTENFSAETENTTVNLEFYTRRQAFGNSFDAAQVITVHYQSTGSAYSGIADCPLIGTAEAVKRVSESSKNLLIAFAILAAAVFSIFAALSVLKHTGEYVSAIVWIFGIAAMLLSRYLLAQTTVVPLFWAAVALCSSFIILVGRCCL